MKKTAIKKISLISFWLSFTLGCVMCKQNSTTNPAPCSDSLLEVNSISNNGSYNMDTAIIFGTKIHLDERLAIKELSNVGILKYDTIEERNGQFASAVVKFASVKFGFNKSFVFITSRQDKHAIDSLVAKISRYYGEPAIDDNGEPEWNYYHWNLYDTLPDRPYIRIRPIHSEEGGMVMTWEFNTYTDL